METITADGAGIDAPQEALANPGRGGTTVQGRGHRQGRWRNQVRQGGRGRGRGRSRRPGESTAGRSSAVSSSTRARQSARSAADTGSEQRQGRGHGRGVANRSGLRSGGRSDGRGRGRSRGNSARRRGGGRGTVSNGQRNARGRDGREAIGRLIGRTGRAYHRTARRSLGHVGDEERTGQYNISSARGSRRSRRKQKRRNATAFHDFFFEGGIGCTLFPRIRAYLTVQDLVACGETGYTLQRAGMCKTFTVTGLLSELTLNINRSTRILIGNTVRSNVTRYSSERERPKRVTWDTESNSFFRANLYHPEELPAIHKIMGQCARLRPVEVVQLQRRYCVNDGSFRGFFAVGCVGHTIFPIIRQYLDVHDLSAFFASGLDPNHDMCKLFTVTQLLQERNSNGGAVVSRDDRIRIGKEAVQCASSAYRGEKSVCRPHRVVEGMGDRWCWNYLYHPSERPLLEQLIDWCLGILRCANSRPDTTEAQRDGHFSATFGTTGRAADVTLRLALLARRNQGILSLRAPPPVTDSRGMRRLQPVTFRHWYIRFFGDPLPHQSKVLVISYVRRGSQEFRVDSFSENTPFSLNLSFLC